MYGKELSLHMLKYFNQSVPPLYSNKDTELILTEHFESIRNIHVDYFDNPVRAKV